MQDAGFYDSEQVRLRRTAVHRLGGLMKAGEPEGDMRWVLEHASILAERLKQEGVKESTRLTYRSRVETTLKAFFQSVDDPHTFWRARHELQIKPTKRQTGANRIELGDGRVFSYDPPVNGLSRTDIIRIATALWAQSAEFDGAGAEEQLPLFVNRKER